MLGREILLRSLGRVDLWSCPNTFQIKYLLHYLPLDNKWHLSMYIHKANIITFVLLDQFYGGKRVKTTSKSFVWFSIKSADSYIEIVNSSVWRQKRSVFRTEARDLNSVLSYFYQLERPFCPVIQAKSWRRRD